VGITDLKCSLYRGAHSLRMTLSCQTEHQCHLKLEGWKAGAMLVHAIAIMTSTFLKAAASQSPSSLPPPTSISTLSVHRPSDSLSTLVSFSSSLPPYTQRLISYPLDFLSDGVYLWLRLTTSAFLLDKPSLDPTNDHSNLLS
jgi:hypothetical protein